MKRDFYFMLLLVFLFSCKNKINSKSIKMKELHIGDIKFECPANFELIDVQGIDSYVAYLVNHTKDTFNIEYGRTGIIYGLQSTPVSVLSPDQLPASIKFYGRMPTSDEVLFSDYPKEDEDSRIFEPNYFMYDTVGGIIMKIEQPKRIGKGITGIYIPKLRDGNSFSMYATNLDSASHIIALKMFRSIGYK